MRSTVRPTSLLFVLVAAAFLSGCGSSASTTTAPATVPRCGITLGGSTSTVPATGGSGALTVTATRECAWTTAVEGNWLTIRAGSSGQGEGTVEFTAAPNPDPQTRTGAIVVNGSRAQISQAAGECVITLDRSSSDFPPSGGSTTIQVRSSSSLCNWTAASNEDWISISSGASGRGNGSATISVAATAGPPRAGSVTIAGQQFSVTQSQGCSYSVSGTTHSASAAGGPIGLTVATAPACPWTAASNVPWITVSPASASGPLPVTLTVAPTQGPERTGTLVVAGQLITVTQSPGCTYSVDPEGRSVGATGGSSSVRIETAPACSWTASSNVSWITIQGASNGVGPADVTFIASATDGPARTGTLNIAGRIVTVTQAQGCDYSISPERQSVGASGGTGTVAVTAGPGCAWTATSSAPWLTITGGASGTGNGEVQFAAAASSGAARSATLTIAGRTFTVDQGQSCSFSLSSTGTAIPGAGGQGSFAIQAAAGCAWTANTSVPWITITSGSSGSGNGTVAFTVAPNSGGERTGTITAGGQTFTITQGAVTTCTFAIAPASRQLAAAGGTTSVAVTAGSGCAWTAASNVPWISVTAGASGTGNGSVQMTVAANTGPARSGSVTIAGQAFTVNQDSGCTFDVSPQNPSAAAAGGTIRIQVNGAAGCAWTASSNAPWITVPENATGTGDGTVDLTVAPNTGPARSGTATVAGRTVTVAQASACTVTLDRYTQAVSSAGGTFSIAVTAPAGCAWSAVSSQGWTMIRAGETGSGNGTVQFEVRNSPSGMQRTATITILDKQFVIIQQ